MKIKSILTIAVLLFFAPLFIWVGCNSNNISSTTTKSDEIVIPVNPDLFIAAGLVEPITKVNYKLSDGSTAECYKIVTNSTPTEHQMGPWCPDNINDGADKGGIWMEGGKAYDVDGAFIKNMASFYKDATWKMYNADGSINVTKTKEACEAAARPDVDPAYKNFCVQCLPSYVTGLKQIFYIPVVPVKSSSNAKNSLPQGPPPGDRPAGPPPGNRGGPPPNGGRGGGGGTVIGIAFNGVNFDPPAPTSAILAAYTLAPLDDNGGHINLHAGYHYHAATGKTKKVTQTDGHAAMIGYAMDGYGMFELLDENGKEPSKLDENRGHYDTVRGYHYHVGPAGGNKFIGGFRGVTGAFTASF